MASIASLDFLLNMNVANWNAGLTQAEARSNRFNNRVRGQFGNLQRSFSGLRTVIVGALAALGGAQILNNVDNLIKLSAATGTSFDEFQRLQFVFDQAGISQDRFTRGTVTLAQRIQQLGDGSVLAERAFDRLGLSVSDFADRSTLDSLRLVLDGLRGIDDATVQAATAAELFGSRLAVSLGPILQQTDGEIVALANSIETIAVDDARRIEQFNDALQNLGRAFTRLATSFSPVLVAFSSLFSGIARVADQFAGLSTVVTSILIGVALRPLIGILGAVVGAFRLFATGITQGTILALGYGRQLQGLTDRQNAWTTSIALTTTRLLGARAGLVATRVAVIGLRAATAVATGGLSILVTTISSFVITTLLDFEGALLALQNSVIAVANTWRRFTNLFRDTDIPLREFRQRVEEVAEGTMDVGDAAGYANGELQELITSLTDGTLSDSITEAPENAETAWQSFLNTSTNVLDQYETLAMDTFNGLGDAIAGFFETGRLSLSDFVADFIRQFARIQINNALGLLFGGAGGFTATARQFGGPVNAGQPYIVGERGPELFIPNGGGVVERNSELGGGGGGTNIVINAVDTQSFEAALARDPAYISNLVQAGNRQLGIR